MRRYSIEVEDTVAAFLEYVSTSRNIPIEVVIADTVFNQVTKISEKITKFFIVSETDL